MIQPLSVPWPSCVDSWQKTHLQSAARLYADEETRPGRWGGKEGIYPAHGQVLTNVLWPYLKVRDSNLNVFKYWC